MVCFRASFTSKPINRFHNLETGDGLYADSIRREVSRDFGYTFNNYFQAMWKVYKEKTLSNPCRCLWNSMNKKGAKMCKFFCKKFCLFTTWLSVGLLEYFLQHDVWFYNSYKNYSKTKNDTLLRLDEWLGIV